VNGFACITDKLEMCANNFMIKFALKVPNIYFLMLIEF
jgi:hypothetical protein